MNTYKKDTCNTIVRLFVLTVLVCVVAIGTAIRIWCFYENLIVAPRDFSVLKRTQRNDLVRYIDQAQNLLVGNGFCTFGRPETELPPLYPIFLALLMWCGITPSQLVMINFTFTIVPVIIFLVLWWQTSRLPWLYAAIALLAAPAQYSNSLQLYWSEPLGQILAFVVLVGLLGLQRKSKLAALALGTAGAATILNSPHMQLVLVPIFIYQLVSLRSVNTVLLINIGFFAVMAPWYSHVWHVTGNFSLSPYQYVVPVWATGYHQWIRTWCVSTTGRLGLMPAYHSDVWTGENWMYEGMERFATREVKDRVLRYRSRLQQVLRAKDMNTIQSFATAERRSVFEVYTDLGENDEFMRELARARAVSKPVLNGALLPAIRAVAVWVEFRNIFWEEEYRWRIGWSTFVSDSYTLGTVKAVKRWIKGGVATLVLVLNALYGIGIIVGTVKSVKYRNGLCLSIFAGILLYTLAGAWLALHEFRRNVVTYPFLVYGLFVADKKESWFSHN